MRKFFVAIILTLISTLAVAAQKTKFDLSSRIGVADVNPQKQLCLSIPNAKLPSGSRLTLISPDSVPSCKAKEFQN